ncbi:hypothetical protein [Amycolatopsis thermophila]|uniref:Uncharacterized protein n=1 Tax=Amycolatopsis thermophila TaxID=206084 RepID=A0ABU0EPW5_9PSEU|nr:hypothetical protein [Amycolatopsis thermophila]MDQ0377297.1 hypothetical protein [Amycolatopsis thermophila]
MDPRDRADALLARAQSRGAFVVTPDAAVSPMDASSTQQIPRSVVDRIDEQDPDTTAVVPSSVIESVQGSIAAEAKPDTRVGMAPVQPEEEVDGLVPTTKTQTGTSDFARRLEGL